MREDNDRSDFVVDFKSLVPVDQFQKLGLHDFCNSVVLELAALTAKELYENKADRNLILKKGWRKAKAVESWYYTTTEGVSYVDDEDEEALDNAGAVQ